jgi:hypothetical protein
MELAVAAGVPVRTIHRLEIGGAIRVAPNRRHGHVSAQVWRKIVEAIAKRGVELTPATHEHGASALV